MQARTDFKGLTRMGRVKLLLASVATLTGLGFASSARAGFATINPPGGGEPTIPAAMAHVYGGTFALEDGVDYSNGTLTAVRIADTLPDTNALPYSDPGPNATDQTWQAGQLQAKAIGSFPDDPSTPFGYIPGTSGGTFKSLFAVTGTGYSVTGSGSFSPSGTFRVAAQNPFGILSSLPSDNVDTVDSTFDGKDYMVSYQIDGLPSSDKTWLLFFDDYGTAGKSPDYDYTDLIIQLQTAPVVTSASVPEPGCLMLLGGTMLALAKRVRRSPRSR